MIYVFGTCGLLPVWQTNQNMDREIPEEEKKIVQTKIIRGSVVAFGHYYCLDVFIHYMSGSIRRSEVILSTVDRGRIELSYAASGVVSPAFEEIINSPIDHESWRSIIRTAMLLMRELLCSSLICSRPRII